MTKQAVFIGGLTNGKIVLSHLHDNPRVEVPLVLTHPGDIDKPRYVDLAQEFPSLNVTRTSEFSSHQGTIRDIKPDFIFVAGCSEMLPPGVIEAPKNGTIGFHPSKLPHDRGRSVLAWQIEEGYRESALTMFYLEDRPDTGDIIGQETFPIASDDYIEDVLVKVDHATDRLMEQYLTPLVKGEAPRRKQDPEKGNYRELRGEDNSRIDWNQSAEDIYNKIRAISRPYPGAFGEYQGRKVRIWKSQRASDGAVSSENSASPGDILSEGDRGGYWVKCGDGLLEIFPEESLSVGESFD